MTKFPNPKKKRNNNVQLDNHKKTHSKNLEDKSNDKYRTKLKSEWNPRRRNDRMKKYSEAKGLKFRRNESVNERHRAII